mgnify:CR=1 FL=1
MNFKMIRTATAVALSLIAASAMAQDVTGAGASYHLVATVNGVKSESVQFILN